MHIVFLGLGSNIQPETNIPKALTMLAEQVDVKKISSAWCTTPVGTVGPNFVNLAVQCLTDLDFETLKYQVLQGIEKQLGRVRTSDKFAPRTIDIDIVLYDGELLEKDLVNAAYLILPLSELIPAFIPIGEVKSLGELALQHAIRNSARQLTEFPPASGPGACLTSSG